MSWTLDDWYNAAQIASVVLVGLTFAVATTTFVLGKKVNDRNNAQIATLDAQRADAELKLEELREKVKDRSLSASQRDTLVEFLKGHPTGTIEIRCPTNAPEPRKFAQEFFDVFNASGWNTTLNDRVISMPPPINLALKIYVSEPVVGTVSVTIPDSTMAILNGFEKVGLSLEREADHSLEKDQLVLEVGYKP